MEKTLYTVGWIAPLPLELTAARSALEEEYGPIYDDKYSYYGGTIGAHNVVIGVQSRIGTDAASDLAARMQAAFPNIEFFLVVGIGGGVPRYGPAGAAFEMVLGDVVVSCPRGNFGGVVRYDSGAWEGEDEGRLNIVGHTNSPPDVLLGAINHLQMNHAVELGTIISRLLTRMRLKIRIDERYKFDDPGPDQDRLFQDNFSHPSNSQGASCQQCCDISLSQQRRGRGSSAFRQTDTPKIHYGNIASSNQLQISPAKRNSLQEKYDVICFEMEGAGVIQRHPCLVVRGICDYSDSHKNKIWQPYAAATAAAYARELLESMPATRSAEDPSVSERKKEIRELLIHLRTTDPRDDKRRIEDTKGSLLNEAYCWILENSDFQKWRDNLQSRLLWIKGDPGKGKTMLLCGIINELKKPISKTHILSYFFCQATDLRINNATAVLRGLLYLLIDQQPSLISHIQKKHDHAGKALFEDTNAWFALSEIFTSILQDLNLKSTYLVIDALDECVTDLPKLLAFIVNNSSPSARVKWLLSSRNEFHIEQKLRSADDQTRLSLELKGNAEQVSRAVDVYIDNKLSHLESVKENEDLRGRVRDILRQKANGTFLWVALVVQELEQPESWDPLQVVEEVPTDLHQLYDRMVNQIQRLSKKNSEICQIVLSVTTVAYRPLYLAEIGSLCKLPGQDLALTKTVRIIVAMCGSFLTIRDNQVYLIHQSAKDYLSDEARATIFPHQRKTHYDIFRQSLKLMSSALQRDMYSLIAPGFPIDQVQVPDPDPLATTRYSCVYWVDHLCDSYFGKNTRQDGGLQDSDLQDVSDVYIFFKTKYLYWLEALSLCKSMPEGLVLMEKLETLIQGKPNASALIELVRDARRFIMYHKWAIEKSPLQVYVSALLFSPARSLIRGLFKKEEPKWIKVKLDIQDAWGACLQTLEGHSGNVSSVAFSHDSKWLATASWDSTVKIWDASSGACLQTLKSHSRWVDSVVFSHNSIQLASASGDSTVKIWDVSSGACLQTLNGHSGDVYSVAFSHNSIQLASASSDSAVKIWDASSGACLQTLKGHSDSVSSVDFSHDSTRLASTSKDGTVMIWDASGGACLQTLEGNESDKRSVAFSHDFTLLASTSRDYTITIWDMSSDVCVCLQVLMGHSSKVSSIAFSRDSTRLVSTSWDNTAKIWDASSGTCLQTLEGHSNTVSSVAFSHDLTLLASASWDKTVKIWDANSEACLQPPKGHSSEVSSVAFSHDLTWLASASDGTIMIWDASSGACLQTLEGDRGDDNRLVAFSHDSTLLAWRSWETVIIWDTSSGANLQMLEGHSQTVLSLAFSHDSTRLATGSYDNTAKIWDASSGACLQTLKGHSNYVTSVAYSHCSTRLASTSEDGTVKIWDASGGACLQTLKGHSDTVSSVAFSHDSTLLASASWDKTVKIWDASSSVCLQTLYISEKLSDISFDTTGLCLRTNIGTITIIAAPLVQSSTLSVTEPQNPRFQGLGLSSDNAWITHNSENLIWLPSEYRPSCSTVLENMIGIGAGSGRVWMLSIGEVS